MVLAHHGLSVPMERLRDLSGTNERGSDLAGLASAAESLGFDTVAADLSFDDLLSRDIWPAILHWDGDHFVVAIRATQDRIDLLDPAVGERRFDRESFEGYRLGSGRSRAGLIIVASPSTQQVVNAAATAPDRAARRSVPNVESRTVEVPVQLWAVTLLYGGFVAAGLYALLRVLRLAIDLQYHETWMNNLGVLLLVLAAALVGRYLVRRTAIRYANSAGQQDTLVLADRIGEDAANPGRAGQTTLSARLTSDIDEMRIWRAYSLGDAYTGTIVGLVALAFAFGTDAVYGAALIGAALLAGVVYFYVDVAESNVRQAALNAQVVEREGFGEYARLLPEAFRSGRATGWLEGRLKSRTMIASRAFDLLTGEVVARAELKLALTYVCVVLLLSLGLYRLGFEGLQVGDLLFVLLLTLFVFGQLRKVAASYLAYSRTSDARSRLMELRAKAAPALLPAALLEAEQLTLRWRGAAGTAQAIEFDRRDHVGFLGSDHVLRQVLIEACLGRENVFDASLFCDDDGGARSIRLTQLGRVALLSAVSPLLAGSIAENIILDAAADYKKLDGIAERLGLSGEDLPAGLATRLDDRGTQLAPFTFVKIILARALYADTDIFVIDGLTDALPAYQEALVFDELLAAAAGKLLLCNARRLSATYGFDLIVQLEAGEIEAIGTHDDLTVSGGAYALQLATEKVAGR